MQIKSHKLAFNRGLISPLGRARADIDRLAFAATIHTNWIPRVLGSMSLRPGWQYLGSVASDNPARLLPFTFSVSDKAIVEFTALLMRVWINDALLSRTAVSTAVLNGTFTASLNGWTSKDEAGATSSWLAIDTPFGVVRADLSAAGVATAQMRGQQGDTAAMSATGAGAASAVGSYDGNETAGMEADGVATATAGAESTVASGLSAAGVATAIGDNSGQGYMQLVGNGTSFAIRNQLITVAAGDQNVEHGLRIVIARGPVVLRVGNTDGGDEYINETNLEEGVHSLAFTPTTGNLYIEFKSRLKRVVWVTSCEIEDAGTVEITSPYTEAALPYLRHDQSGDVLFVASDCNQQYQVQRRTATSWSLVKYYSDNGPFRTLNLSNTTIASSAISGNVSLTASDPLFRSGHVGALFSITSAGQAREIEVAAENTFSGAIIITGIDSSRVFQIEVVDVTATGSTITLQRSYTSENGPWEDVPGQTYTTDSTTSFDDTYDNVIAWYRIGCKTGDYSAGTIDCTLRTATGAITGIVRITDFNSPTSVDAEVLTDLGGTAASSDWEEGEWSDFRGWPTAVALFGSRLWWAGRDKIYGTEVDAYYSLNTQNINDDGPIVRSIGSGPVDNISWILALRQILLGGDGAVYRCQSTSFDEPLTPSNFHIHRTANQGAAATDPAIVDARGVFVQRGGIRAYELSTDQNGTEYDASHLSALVPLIGDPQIIRVATQRQPDTRIHFVRSDGTVAMMVYDRVENVIAWLDITTNGTVEDVVVLPSGVGQTEDLVYYVVARTVSGQTKRYLEKWAFEDEALGASLNKQADSFIQYSQSASSIITGLSHLEGHSVVVWDAGKCLRDSNGDIATFTVSSGQITVTNGGAGYNATTGIVGLSYTAQWQSSKLTELYSQPGLGLAARARISKVAFVLSDTHYQGIQFGRDFSNLDSMPRTIESGPIAEDTVFSAYDEEQITFPGTPTHNSRLCLQAQAPRPATVVAAVLDVEAF